MRFHFQAFLFSLALTTTTIPPIRALVTILAYRNRLSCSSTALTYTANETECVRFPTDYGTCVEFRSLPPGTIGQIYNGTDCQQGLYDQEIQIGGYERSCWIGGNRRAQSAVWLPAVDESDALNRSGSAEVVGSYRRAETSDVEPAGGSSGCTPVLPHAFTYALPNGNERTIKLPASQEGIDLILALQEAQDFDSLEGYEGF